MRTWHVQLAIFWVAASFLATGIFIVPLIAGREPRGQGALTMMLLVAVAIVVFGSLAGEYAGVKGWLGDGFWFWLGHQGWEYLDLGRLWQILLVVGLLLWGVHSISRLARHSARRALRQLALDAFLRGAWRYRLSMRWACSPARARGSPSMIFGASGSCTYGWKLRLKPTCRHYSTQTSSK